MTKYDSGALSKKAENGRNNIPPFLAFVAEAQTLKSLRALALSKKWGENCIHEGNAATATEYLKNNPTPEILVVEIPSAEAAPELLDRLADVCRPGVKVIVSGRVNEFSFYTWLKDMGISDYLLQPVTREAAQNCIDKLSKPQKPVTTASKEKSARVIAVTGSRGGVGATTIAVNIAWIIGNHYQHPTMLMDFDPLQGTTALQLDMMPGRGLRDALEKPERIDALFMDQMTAKYDDKLAVLAAEESWEQDINIRDNAADRLIGEAKKHYDFLIIDVPRNWNPFVRKTLSLADEVMLVTELHITAMRDSLRMLDIFRDKLKAPPPSIVANRVGLAAKYEMPKGEFAKGLGCDIKYSVPFEPLCYAAADSGELLAASAKQSPATQELCAMAAALAGEDELPSTAATKNPLISWLKRGGK